MIISTLVPFQVDVVAECYQKSGLMHRVYQ